MTHRIPGHLRRRAWRAKTGVLLHRLTLLAGLAIMAYPASGRSEPTIDTYGSLQYLQASNGTLDDWDLLAVLGGEARLMDPLGFQLEAGLSIPMLIHASFAQTSGEGRVGREEAPRVPRRANRPAKSIRAYRSGSRARLSGTLTNTG